MCEGHCCLRSCTSLTEPTIMNYRHCDFVLNCRREKLIENVKKQVALEERAYRIVEELTEVIPTEEYLKDAVS